MRVKRLRGQLRDGHDHILGEQALVITIGFAGDRSMGDDQLVRHGIGDDNNVGDAELNIRKKIRACSTQESDQS